MCKTHDEIEYECDLSKELYHKLINADPNSKEAQRLFIRIKTFEWCLNNE